MFTSLLIAFKKRSVYRQTMKELNSLSNKELSDLGLERYDIENIAREAAYGKEKNPSFSFTNLFKTKSEKDRIEEYLADSSSTIDLENRIRNIDRGNAPWQIEGKNFARGWVY